VTLKGQTRDDLLDPDISKTAGNRGLVPNEHQQEMACGESNGHVTDDIT